MRTPTPTVEVTVTVSKPYVVIGGGWTGLRPQGIRRRYTATVNGTDIVNENKAEIQRVVRTRVRREHGTPVRVTFIFVETGQDAPNARRVSR